MSEKKLVVGNWEEEDGGEKDVSGCRRRRWAVGGGVSRSGSALDWISNGRDPGYSAVTIAYLSLTVSNAPWIIIILRSNHSSLVVFHGRCFGKAVH